MDQAPAAWRASCPLIRDRCWGERLRFGTAAACLGRPPRSPAFEQHLERFPILGQTIDAEHSVPHVP